MHNWCAPYRYCEATWKAKDPPVDFETWKAQEVPKRLAAAQEKAKAAHDAMVALSAKFGLEVPKETDSARCLTCGQERRAALASLFI